MLHNYGDVMVVGGGISGIQAALDLATSGFKVWLVDKSPTIGGHMALLDKTFPTNDCSMCIESPKFIECDRHPNIEILTYTEVEKVEGSAGNFEITLIKRPRYIDEKRCTGCTACVEYCPINYPDQFNQEISVNKAIHIYFAQAVPLVTYIDESCLYLKEGKCRICERVCGSDAIDFNQRPERRTIKVGAVILAPGIEAYDPSVRKEYHYGDFANVVTALDFERLLCATGPYGGEILRPTDKKHPHKIAWIQCVGSRRVTNGDNSYCSSVCCTYTQKQVILTKGHDPGVECTIFHNDIRSFGKDFERFYQRAMYLDDVRFIRSYPSIVSENPENRNVTLRYATDNEGVKEEEFDMVVLSVGLTPPSGMKGLAKIFGIELNQHGFCLTNPINPMETSRKGIFTSGAITGPMDIPESVVTASGAGSLCGELLNYQRGELARERVYPHERDCSGEIPRVGVYVCHCGANIGKVVDIPSTVEYALTLPNVVHAEESLFICSTDAAKSLAASISEKRLNRVVVAACTPRTHEPLFRDTLREAGINQYYFEFANIREHCSWVHSREKEAATQKAKDLIRMSVARACKLEPLNEFDLPVNKKTLVVGGGIAGMTSALSLANQGYQVYLVEKAEELGGTAKRLFFTLEGMDVQAHLKELINKVHSHPLIHIFKKAVITGSTGYVGNFTTKIRSGFGDSEINHGVTIIATGADEYRPTEYLYGDDDRVITQLELEQRIFEDDKNITEAGSIVMIQCVGCRNDVRNYCSRVCCTQAIKNALRIREVNPEADISILFRDMRSYRFSEDYYRKASDMDIRFIRYEPDAPPEAKAFTENGKKGLRITAPDYILNKRIALDADLLVLSAAVVPSPAGKETARMFKLTLGPDGFFQEAHVKLRPVDFAAEGVYLCGMAHYPKHITETISQAYGAAGRAVALLSHDTVVASGSVCTVYEDKCISCGACIKACTYGAISFVETLKGKKARVNPVLCKGDGLCNAKCPAGAISLKHFTDEEIFAQIDAAE
ncbi:MAG: CoB--CoM heterodisulfide reductase iron-sulfur subunit A family protein [Desulfatiglans sp.]|nr:CoB--CoM heterodisulfide reductase iron-sulfur subunit A family protein [Desulfatiglans sp.]